MPEIGDTAPAFILVAVLAIAPGSWKSAEDG